ncbi:phosphotransferase family protein [Brevibacterium sp. CT2-23B]|uniref:phosphotransferase family protein n=1 Tax=Brevibacterium sp. CT2-23B TaxID=2729630 RepID=UPI001552E2C9
MNEQTSTLESASDSRSGVDLVRLTTWLEAEHSGLIAGDLSVRLIEGGKSNLTYELTDGTHDWILRRPPLGKVMATAHDMKREFTIAGALRGAVPVPEMIAYCDDHDVLGADFYIMERIDGVPYRFREELEPLGAEQVEAIGKRLISILVDLHQVDPAEVGLTEFGRPEGFLARQVSRWKKQLDASRTRELPGADELHAELEARVPAHSAAGIVHGDFRLDNVLMGADDRPAAIIDWELATLGEPLMDLALMLTYQKRARLVADWPENLKGPADATLTPGYPSENAIIEQYAAESGRDLDGFGFHLGLACFKLAGISEGVRYRHLKGQMLGDGFENVGNAVPLLIEIGHEALKEFD